MNKFNILSICFFCSICGILLSCGDDDEIKTFPANTTWEDANSVYSIHIYKDFLELIKEDDKDEIVIMSYVYSEEDKILVATDVSGLYFNARIENNDILEIIYSNIYDSSFIFTRRKFYIVR